MFLFFSSFTDSVKVKFSEKININDGFVVKLLK